MQSTYPRQFGDLSIEKSQEIFPSERKIWDVERKVSFSFCRNCVLRVQRNNLREFLLKIIKIISHFFQTRGKYFNIFDEDFKTAFYLSRGTLWEKFSQKNVTLKLFWDFEQKILRFWATVFGKAVKTAFYVFRLLFWKKNLIDFEQKVFGKIVNSQYCILRV